MPQPVEAVGLPWATQSGPVRHCRAVRPTQVVGAPACRHEGWAADRLVSTSAANAPRKPLWRTFRPYSVVACNLLAMLELQSISFLRDLLMFFMSVALLGLLLPYSLLPPPHAGRTCGTLLPMDICCLLGLLTPAFLRSPSYANAMGVCSSFVPFTFMLLTPTGATTFAHVR